MNKIVQNVEDENLQERLRKVYFQRLPSNGDIGAPLVFKLLDKNEQPNGSEVHMVDYYATWIYASELIHRINELKAEVEKLKGTQIAINTQKDNSYVTD